MELCLFVHTLTAPLYILISGAYLLICLIFLVLKKVLICIALDDSFFTYRREESTTSAAI